MSTPLRAYSSVYDSFPMSGFSRLVRCIQRGLNRVAVRAKVEQRPRRPVVQPDHLGRCVQRAHAGARGWEGAWMARG